MTAPTQPPAEQADRIRRAFDAHLCTRAEAVDALRSILDITVLGAEELLDNSAMPSTRWVARCVASKHRPYKGFTCNICGAPDVREAL